MNPMAVKVEAGSIYWWCRCGLSRSPPFCDGTHKGGEFFPLKYTATRSGQLSFCTCRRSATPPLCDGSHGQDSTTVTT